MCSEPLTLGGGMTMENGAFAVAALLGGYLVTRCGYLAGAAPLPTTLQALRTTLIVTPLIGLACAVVAIVSYPLSHERLRGIQAQLDARRVAATPQN